MLNHKTTGNRIIRSVPAMMAILMLCCTLIGAPVFAASTNAVKEDNADTFSVDIDTGIAGGAFEVTNYDFSAEVNKDHSYEVEEKITVNVPAQLQKIQFDLPRGNFRISGMELDGAPYAASTSTEINSITINDISKLTPGTHEYTIKYKIREFADRDETQDMFYFNVIPTEWKQPIGKASISVKFPEDFPWDDIQCYAGQFGVQDVNNKVTFKDSEADKTVTISGEKIPENYGITIKAELPDGYWQGAMSGSWVINAIMYIMVAVLLLLALLWLIGGRDPRIPKVTQTRPPEGIQASEIGYIFNGEVGIRDILMILIYFGKKGYLSISEYEHKKYRIYRKEDPSGEEKLYRNAYNILFEDVYKDRAVEMEDLGDRLIRIRDSIKDDVAAGYSSHDSLPFTPMSRMFRWIAAVILGLGLAASNALSYVYHYLPVNYIESIIIAIVTFAAAALMASYIDQRDFNDEENKLKEILSGFMLLAVTAYTSLSIYKRTENPMPAIILALCALAAAFFITVMRARGKDNAELVMKIRQLRNFIYHPTPKELLDNHLADENYYYDMLQYALTSGAEESWAISFLTLKVPEPEWYSDDTEGHAFSNLRDEMTTVDYARDLKTFMRTIEAAFEDLQRRRRRR